MNILAYGPMDRARSAMPDPPEVIGRDGADGSGLRPRTDRALRVDVGRLSLLVGDGSNSS